MSREIKFRAWDVKTKKFITSNTHEASFTLFADGRGVAGVPYSWQGSEDPKHFIISQFIGLKDKKRKDIYEEDIVECKHWSPSKYRISFTEGAFCLCDLKTGEWVADVTHMEDSTGKHFSVVGNIHENPELLKGDQQNG